jgi:hypothetical protein
MDVGPEGLTTPKRAESGREGSDALGMAVEADRYCDAMSPILEDTGDLLITDINNKTSSPPAVQVRDELICSQLNANNICRQHSWAIALRVQGDTTFGDLRGQLNRCVYVLHNKSRPRTLDMERDLHV